MITRLGHATIFVLDHDVAIDFYINKLGFTLNTDVKMDNGFRWVTVNAPKQPDLELILMKLAGGDHSPISDSTVGHIKAILDDGNMGVGVFDCDDCQATYEDLKAKGVEFTREPAEQFYGVEATFKDPFGNWYSMCQRKPH